MTMTAQRAGGFLVATILLCTGVSVTPASGSRRLAIVVRPDDVELLEIDRILRAVGMQREPGVRFDNGAGVTVLETGELSPSAEPHLFEVAARLEELDGVLAAGELLLSRPDRRLVYSGCVLVQLRDDALNPALQSWERRHAPRRVLGTLVPGLTRDCPPMRVREPHVLFRAPLDWWSLFDLVNDLPDSVGRATPIHHDVRPPRPLEEKDVGGYHLLDRNHWAVELKGGPPNNFDTIIGGPERVDTVGDVEFWRFDTEAEMMDFQREQRRLDSSKAMGPALSSDPPRYLDDKLIVGFTNAPERYAATWLLKRYNLNPVRELPYLENGYLFRGPEPSYDLYRAAKELLAGKYASLAVPNVVSKNLSLCATSGDCATAGHQEYLRMIRAPGAWESDSTCGGETVIGVLDEGFQADRTGVLCDELNVAAMLNAMDTANPLPLPLWCFPRDWSNWCADPPVGCYGTSIPNAAHGIGMAMTAAARFAATLIPSDYCDFRVGVAPGAPLLDVAIPGSGYDTALASAMWWMAGGEETDYAPPLKGVHQDRRATVLNLSFERVYEADEECPVGGSRLCEPVCRVNEECSILDAVQERLGSPEEEDAQFREEKGIRREGILVVAAISVKNDFGAATHTAAVGTMARTGEPFHSAVDLDVVVPMGDDQDTNLTDSANPPAINVGSSSAAAAAVSGVAAMMFDVNPYLTAAQAHCILRQSANKSPRSAGGSALWDSAAMIRFDTNPGWNCRFDGGKSKCFGYGMLDAAGAVKGAAACRPETITALTYDKDLEMAMGWKEIVIPVWVGDESVDYLIKFGEDFSVSNCRCDAAGNRLAAKVNISKTVSAVCLNCATRLGESVAPLEKIRELLDCVENKTCACPSGDPTCVSVELVNPRNVDFLDVRVQFCTENEKRCKTIRPKSDTWSRGTKMSLALPTDDKKLMRVWWDAGRSGPKIKVFSGKKQIEFDRKEEPVRFSPADR